MSRRMDIRAARIGGGGGGGDTRFFLVGIPVLIVKENVQIQVDRTRIRSTAIPPC